MGLISRVSSRTYRNPTWTKKQNLKNGAKRQASGYGPNQETRWQEEEFRQPSLREAIQELWRGPGHSAKTRSHPIRSMAKIHQAPAPTCRPPAATQGAPKHQPVQPDFGQADRHPAFQASRQIRSRSQGREESSLGGQGQGTS